MALDTGNPFIDALGGAAWPSEHTSPVDGALLLSVYFDNDTSDGHSTGGAWTDAEKAGFWDVLHAWSSVANIRFREVDNASAADLIERKVTADYGLPDHNTPDQSMHVGSYPTPWSPVWGLPGGPTFETFLHELGHALGLAHPHDLGMGTGLFPGIEAVNPGGAGDPSDTGDNGLNTSLYTVMSYNRAPGADPNANRGYATTPMAFDIAAIQLMYGAVASNAGNTVYTLRDDAAGASYSCIWDTGGIDTIQYAGTRDAFIDLRAATLGNKLGGGGSLSSVDGVAGGFTIAADITDFDGDGNFGVVIENAIGGSGNDTLTGNDASNRLEGGAGADELYGRGGLDVLIGGAGNDAYLLQDVSLFSAGGILVGEGYDTIVEAADEGVDTVLVGHVAGSLLDHTHYTLPDNVENGRVLGFLGFILPPNAFDPFDLTGNELNNELTGNDAANTLVGLDGSDTLDGRGGLDTLIGGAGNDTYVLNDVSRLDGLFAGEVYDGVVEDANGGTDTVKVGRVAGQLFDHTHYALPDHVENGMVEGAGAFDLTGNDLDNQLSGNRDANVLVGGGGSDALYGSDGLDTLIGGADDDTYWLTDVSRLDGPFFGEVYDTVVEAAGEGIDWIEIGPVEGILFDHTRYTLPENVENARLHGDDPFDVTGNGLENRLIGSDGINTLSGLDGRDTLEGGDGLDTLIGGAGDDTYVLNDVSRVGGLFIGEVYDSVIEDVDGGTDLVQVGRAAGSLFDITRYLLPDNVENGRVDGIEAFDLTGNELSNRLEGNGAVNTLDGAGGRDFLFGNAGDDVVRGGGGNDFLAGGFNSRIEATGFDGNDIVYGDAGDDLIMVLWGNDTVHGGDDNDTLSFADVNGDLSLDLSAGSVSYGDGGIIRDELGNTVGGFAGQYTVTWDGIENVIGGAGSDVIGGDGNGNRLDGGLGADTAAFRGARSQYTITMLANGDIQVADGVAGRDGTDVLANFEALRFSDGDVAVSMLQAIVGTPGEDRLVGDGGANHLLGLAGNDILIGNGGADILDGGADIDTADYSGSTAGVSIDLAAGTGHGGDAEGDTLISIEQAVGSVYDDTFRGGSDRGRFLAGDGNDTMIGGSWFDWLEGGDGDDTFIGAGGQMVMFGGAGDDRMIGSLDNWNYFDAGLGDDVLVGGSSVDYMADVSGGDDTMHGGGGDDVLVDLYGATQLYGEDGNDLVTSAGGSGLLDGGAGVDYVSAANGSYMMLGGDGADTLEFAGTGSASFTGGDGADIFTYRVGAGPVTVTDFEDGTDHIFLWDNHYYGNVPFESLTIADGADGAVISWNGWSEMVLTGVQASQLDRADFLI